MYIIYKCLDPIITGGANSKTYFMNSMSGKTRAKLVCA